MAGTKLFADRGYLFLNGFEILHCKSLELDVDDGVAPVDTMSRNYRSAGYKRNNRKINISAELDVELTQAQIDLAVAQLNGSNKVSGVVEIGGERYNLVDVAQGSFNLRASVGDASKPFKFMALDCVNENGTSVVSSLSLG